MQIVAHCALGIGEGVEVADDQDEADQADQAAWHHDKERVETAVGEGGCQEEYEVGRQDKVSLFKHLNYCL